jgi:hypothetical protein
MSPIILHLEIIIGEADTNVEAFPKRTASGMSTGKPH